MASRLSNAALLDPIGAISAEELHKNFHVLEHSSEDIQDTQIFFLGNTHYLQEHAWKIEWFIQRLYQKGDIFLVEYSGKYPRLFQTLRYSTPAMLPLDLKGWDSSVKEDKIEDKECLIEALLHIDSVRRTSLMRENWIEEIHRLVRMFPPPSHVHDQIIKERFSKDKLTLLSSPEERLRCFNEIVRDLCSLWVAHIESLLNNDEQEERNRSMIQTLDQHSECPRIFVQTGIAHVTLNPQFHRNLSTTTMGSYLEEKKYDVFYPHLMVNRSREAVELVHHYLEGKKYAVLYPTNDNSSLQEIREELLPSSGTIIQRFWKLSSCTTRITAVVLAPLACLVCPPITCLGCVGLTATLLSCTIYTKSREYYTPRGAYRDSLSNLSLLDLLTLIGHAADHPENLPVEEGKSPLKMSKEEEERLSDREGLCAGELHGEASSSISEFSTLLNQPHHDLQT